MPALQLIAVSKNYGQTQVLNKLSLSFPDKQITAIIGASGCGKSTVLKMCNGLVQPDTGQVIAFGQPLDYTAIDTPRRRMGYAVQGTGLFPHMSARENIMLLALLEGWSDAQIEVRLEELLQLTSLQPDHLNKYPHELSGGQQQRVGLCRAMMLRPEVMLLDEPFAAIDPITRTDIHQQLLTLHKAEPTTAVLVTHDMREAMLLADHIVVMGAGFILRSEAKTTLLEGRRESDPETLLHELLSEADA